MGRRVKGINKNRLCENCGLPLGNRVPSARYCLRLACRNELNKKWNKSFLEKRKLVKN